MKIALCNEVIRELPFAEQCSFAAALGYEGLELAPFTFGEAPHLMPAHERGEIRRQATDAGLEITGLHWLLVTPLGLSITSPESGIRQRTADVLARLIALCHDLGGRVMVHGSPQQRLIAKDQDPEAAWAGARDLFRQIADAAEAAGITYCIEPLAPGQTDFINTVAEAAALVEAVGHPAIRTMVDCAAASQAEADPIPELLDRWLPTGLIGHIQVNDRNQRGPGQGAVRFAPIFQALGRNNYDKIVAVEPFDYTPDGPAAAARAIGYIRGILEASP